MQLFPKSGTGTICRATSSSDAWGAYSGFDRLGRIVDQKWKKRSDSWVVDQYRYGYDAAGNRLWRDVSPDVNPAPTLNDELCAYDDLSRLTGARRGNLNANRDALVSTGFRQNWSLDGVGNWGVQGAFLGRRDEPEARAYLPAAQDVGAEA